MAQEFLQYEQKNLKPLSTDGREGREFQHLLIGDAIEACKSDSLFVHYLLPKCSEEIRKFITSKTDHDAFVSELANEFSSVVDAEFIRLGTPQADRYLSDTRESWQLKLLAPADREAVLRIHSEYCNLLEKSSRLSMDQMTADFSRYLNSHEWRHFRDRQGFDVVFVDELHYFNRAERMLFQNLFRSAEATPIDVGVQNREHLGESRRVPIFMAYDLKQSVTDAFMRNSRLDSAGNIFKSVGAGETDLVELSVVFRSTPQIHAFLTDLDASFPALDMEGEWGSYAQKVQSDDGPVPRLKVYPNSTALLDDVYERASRAAKDVGGRHVAVLCLSNQLFDTYSKAGRIKDKHVVVIGREDLSELKFARSRHVLSTPEYVAGLQFEQVFLIHLDKGDEVDDNLGIGARRRFVSLCYLGASRASKELFVAAAADRGGPAAILDGPLRRKSLLRIP